MAATTRSCSASQSRSDNDFNKVIFLAFEKKIATMDNVEYSNYHDLLGIAGDRRLV